MSHMTPSLDHHQRMYVTVAARTDGRLDVRLSSRPPATGDFLAALIPRGMVAADPTVLTIATALPPVSPIVGLGTVKLVEQAAGIAISAGVRTLTVALPGVAKGDAVALFPVDPLPAGYMIQTAAVASAAGVIKATLIAPLLAISVKYEIVCRALRLG